MRDRLTKSNDDQLPTRAELEAANRELKASLKKCEALVADCRDKLAAAHEVKTDLTKR
jgi:cellobiose-specific phosphotransferase system component IIA